MNRKIIVSVNTAWNVVNFRAGLIKELVKQGYEVTAVAPYDEYVQRLRNLGCGFISMPMDSNGTHPGRDLLLLMRYFRLLRAEKPMAYLGYTVKPNVYGSLAAHMLRIPVINNIAGLGTAFINHTAVTSIVQFLYKMSLGQSHRIFFQNRDDRTFFIQAGLVRPERTDLIPGSGIDPSSYVPVPPAPRLQQSFRFLLVARMLKDKGVIEFVEAARMIRSQSPHVQFQLLGVVDSANANSISSEWIKRWEDDGLIRYLGKTDDVRPYVADSDCVVLPSYREGLPRALLEAAAMGRPIIASDTAGCRDVVDDQVNGLLCQVRNADDLAKKMRQMIMLSPEQRLAMGEAGRDKVKSEFNEKIVIQKYLNAINGIADEIESGKRDEKSNMPMRDKKAWKH
jgi:glycosyltransferase involved in cell wall biosynthesis